MFESLISIIKRKPSNTTEHIYESKDTHVKTGFKRSLHLLKLKFIKTDAGSLAEAPVDNSNDLALCPRAISTSDFALTEIEWPVLPDNNPNILDRFTRIITITDNEVLDNKVRQCIR